MNTYTVDAYVVDVLMSDLAGHDRRPSAFLVYLFLATRAGTGRRRAVALSYQDLAIGTGLSKSAVQGAVAWLRRRRLVQVSQETPTSTPEYDVLRPWARERR
jgi:hypothetical protein